MGVFPGDQVGETLRPIEGNPYRWRLSRTVGPPVLAGIAGPLVALVIAFAAVAATAGDDILPGLDTDPPGNVVTAVDPTGFVWWAGIRPGQIIVSGRTADQPGGWRMTTVDATGRTFVAEAAPIQSALERSLPFAIIATFLAAAAIGFRSAWRQGSDLAAMVSVQLAAVPLVIQGDAIASTAALAAGLVVPASWAIGRQSSRAVRIGLAVALCIALPAWALARLSGADVYGTLESVRSNVALLLIGAALIALVAIPVWRRQFLRGFAIRAADVLALGVLTGIAVLLLMVAHLPSELVALIVVIAFIVYPGTRRGVVTGADRLVLDEVRETAALKATERERTRMASELHDASMQQLAAVIRKLERLPEASPEREALLEVADQLRSVATGMRPPVLDDLGLVPALSFLAERATRPNIDVLVDVADATTITPGGRLAPDVELELYRICEEAVNNAVAHAAAGRIDISGSVSTYEVDLVIRDDGVGLSDAAMQTARAAGRLGLVSMRRRAAGIGADVAIRGGGGTGRSAGTRVEVRWRR